MANLLLVLRPRRFRSANRKAALSLFSTSLAVSSDLLLIDLPEGMEALLALNEPSRIFKVAIERGLLPLNEPLLYSLEPIVEGVLKIRRHLPLRVKCFLEPSLIKEELEVYGEVLKLLFRASIKKFSPLDFKDWLDFLDKYRSSSQKWLQPIANKLAALTSQAERPVGLVGLEAWSLVKLLEGLGLKVKLISAGLPYLKTPLEIMEALQSKGVLTRSLTEGLVMEFLNYVKNFVMKMESLDEAHEAWTLTKAPWLSRFKF